MPICVAPKKQLGLGVQEPSIKQADKDINVLHYGLVQEGNRRKVCDDVLEQHGL